MFVVENLTVDYPGHRIFDDLTVTLGPDPVALMGPSGSGKSTLLRVLAGQQSFGGSVSLDDVEVSPPGARTVGDARIAVIHQDYRLVDFLSIGENLMLGAESRGLEMSSVACDELLELVGLGYLPQSRMPHSLSGGEQQRVAIARALAMRCRALVADEPTGALDFDNTGLIAQLLVSVCAERGVLLIRLFGVVGGVGATRRG